MTHPIKHILTAAALVLTMTGTAVADPMTEANAAVQRGDWASSTKILQPLAEQGDPKAMVLLGLALHKGLGVPRDDEKSLGWFDIAEAIFPPGSLYQKQAIGFRDEVSDSLSPAQRGQASDLEAQWFERQGHSGVMRLMTRMNAAQLEHLSGMMFYRAQHQGEREHATAMTAGLAPCDHSVAQNRYAMCMQANQARLALHIAPGTDPCAFRPGPGPQGEEYIYLNPKFADAAGCPRWLTGPELAARDAEWAAEAERNRRNHNACVTTNSCN